MFLRQCCTFSIELWCLVYALIVNNRSMTRIMFFLYVLANILCICFWQPDVSMSELLIGTPLQYLCCDKICSKFLEQVCLLWYLTFLLHSTCGHTAMWTFLNIPELLFARSHDHTFGCSLGPQRATEKFVSFLFVAWFVWTVIKSFWAVDSWVLEYKSPNALFIVSK